MLDDVNVIKQRDPRQVFANNVGVCKLFRLPLAMQSAEHDGRTLTSCIIIGGLWAKNATRLAIGIAGNDVRCSVTAASKLPSYAGADTLVLIIDDSNDAFDSYQEARQKNCQITVVATEGELLMEAANDSVAHIAMPTTTSWHHQTVLYVRSVLTTLSHFGICSHTPIEKMADASSWLEDEVAKWDTMVPTHENYAKQTALLAVGKTGLFYDSPLTSGLAGFSKAAWSEYAKNLAYTGSYPDDLHTMSAWLSHPIEKPFAVFDVVDNNDIKTKSQIDAVNRVLSGRRPKSIQIYPSGDSRLQKYMWTMMFVSTVALYLAYLNNVRPDSSDIAEKLAA